jgi:hypothetical protein
MRFIPLVLALLVIGGLGCKKEESKPITSEAEMRKATDEMVKRQMGAMGQPMPGGTSAPGPAPEPGASK